jgi:hypothetical protein
VQTDRQECTGADLLCARELNSSRCDLYMHMPARRNIVLHGGCILPGLYNHRHGRGQEATPHLCLVSITSQSAA